MAVLTVNTLNRAGFNLSDNDVAADADGDSFPNTGKELAYFDNGSGGAITVTLVFKSGLGIDGQSPTNRTVSVPAGERVLVGPFPKDLYNDANSRMNFEYSAVTSLTVAVVAPDGLTGI